MASDTVISSYSSLQAGDEAFSEGRFDTAFASFSAAVAAHTPGAHARRAAAALQLERFNDAASDVAVDIAARGERAGTLFIQGQAMFGLKRFREAGTALRKALALATSEADGVRSRVLIDSIRDMLGEASDEVMDDAEAPEGETAHLSATVSPVVAATAALPHVPLRATDATPVPSPAAPPPVTAAATTSSAVSKRPRYEWYQTATHVTVTFHVRDANEKASTITVGERTLSVALGLPGGTEYVQDITLCGRVERGIHASTWRAMKVEVKLTKAAGAQHSWPALEVADEGVTVASKPVAAAAATVAAVAAPSAPVAIAAPLPTPYASRRDWRSLERAMEEEEKNEKPEGEEALQKLFRQIYAGADEDTRRAMNKSFATSGGTVLSTNWKEVGQRDYEKEGVEPPKGMEHRKWNE